MAKTGTKEWSDFYMNIQRGCENGCLYCYAKYNAVERFHRCKPEHWILPCIDEAKVDLPHKKKYNGVVMYPTTHDITSANLSQYLCVLRKLLDADNQVLIISKPRWECITVICEAYLKYRKQIMFRFTIGSTNDHVLRFWEPGASSFEERISCLRYAHHKGYRTSISCEPMLDFYIPDLYDRCQFLITDSFWVGKLRNWKSRVQEPKSFPSPIEENIYNDTKAAQSDKVVRAIYESLKDKPMIKWKDSIRKVMGI